MRSVIAIMRPARLCGKAGFDVSAGFASNGYGTHSPGGYSLGAALVTEVVMTFMFLFVIHGATDKRAPQGFAPIAIGLCLTLIHLISIPVTNISVNPARSTGVAVFVGGWAIQQLWLFWVAPIIGGVLGGLVYRWLGEETSRHKFISVVSIHKWSFSRWAAFSAGFRLRRT
jgi:aquaporin Z